MHSCRDISGILPQGLKSDGNSYRDGGENQGDADDPERTQQVRLAEAHGRPAGEVPPRDDEDEEGGYEIESPLPGIWGPYYEKDEAVADAKFKEIATFAGRRCETFRMKNSSLSNSHS